MDRCHTPQQYNIRDWRGADEDYTSRRILAQRKEKKRKKTKKTTPVPSWRAVIRERTGKNDTHTHNKNRERELRKEKKKKKGLLTIIIIINKIKINRLRKRRRKRDGTESNRGGDATCGPGWRYFSSIVLL